MRWNVTKKNGFGTAGINKRLYVMLFYQKPKQKNCVIHFICYQFNNIYY